MRRGTPSTREPEDVTNRMEKAPVVERITFHGHRMIRSVHRKTIEVTTDEHLTENGDCVIGVGANRGCADLDDEVKSALRRDHARVRVMISTGGESFELMAEGDSGLELSHPGDIVIRRSRFISDRTLAVGASAAAIDIPRSIVLTLKNPLAVGLLEIEVERV